MPGWREADGAGVNVGLVAEGERAAAEHLRPRLQLDVDLEADDRLVSLGQVMPRLPPAGLEADRPLDRVGRVEEAATRRTPGAQIWRPTGSSGPPPSGWASPAGIEIAGMPASDIGTVQ